MLAALTVLLAAPGTSAAPPDAGLLAPGRSLGGIALGASRAEVVASWGRAFGRCRFCPIETLYFNRFAFRPEGAAVELGQDRVVAVFTLWAPPGWRTTDGLRIDEPLARLEATYRPLRRSACRGYDAYVLPGSGARSVVYVLDGRVWGFALLGRGHAVCL
ncbi:MAG: hypothetical protein M5U27_07095 [Gaiella sp.]|nr:hypothetical protein [Gaiella sp.]